MSLLAAAPAPDHTAHPGSRSPWHAGPGSVLTAGTQSHYPLAGKPAHPPAPNCPSEENHRDVISPNQARSLVLGRREHARQFVRGPDTNTRATVQPHPANLSAIF